VKKPLPISEEMLNAFIDDELEGNDRDIINKMEATNKDLAKAICDARRLKALVKSARTKEPIDITYNHLSKKQEYKVYYIAASFILALSITLFLVINETSTNPSVASGKIYNDRNSLLVAASEQANLNLVLHLKSSEPKKTNDLFKILNSALQISHKYKSNLHVEVILSSGGLKLLQKEYSTYSSTISKIGRENPNVTFIACGITLQQLQKNSNKKLHLIKEAMLVSSGQIWAKKRQNKGWSYLLI